MNDSISVFLSYSHSDPEMIESLQKHLESLQKNRESLKNSGNIKATWLGGDFSTKHLEFAVEDFLTNKNKNEQAIMHFCSHGYLDPDEGVCLSKWNANQETQIKVLSLEWLNKLADRCSQPKVLTVLDCHFPKALNTNDINLINRQVELSTTPVVVINTFIKSGQYEKRLLVESSTCSNLHRQYVKKYLGKYLSNLQDRMHPVDIGISILEGFSRPDLPQKQKELFSEYYRLSILPEVSEEEEERMDKILALAEDDNNFAKILSKVDELVYKTLDTKASQNDCKIQINKALELINMELYEAELSETEEHDNQFDDFPIPIPKKNDLIKLTQKLEILKTSKNGDNAIEEYLPEPNELTSTKDNSYQLASEYYCLSIQPELSEAEEERMDKILTLAEENNNFAELIRKVDPLIYQKLGIETSKDYCKTQIDKAVKIRKNEGQFDEDELEILWQRFSTRRHFLQAQSSQSHTLSKIDKTLVQQSLNNQTSFSETSLVKGILEQCLNLVNPSVQTNSQTISTHIQRGHSNCVISICFSPDGTRIASVSYDNTIRLWDLTSHQTDGSITLSSDEQSRHISFQEHRISSIDFSPDGTHLVSGGYDKTLRLWDLTSHQTDGSITLSSDEQSRHINLQENRINSAIQSFSDGLLVISADSQLLYKNKQAIRLMAELSINNHHDEIPEIIWTSCKNLKNVIEEFPEANPTISEEIEISSDMVLRIRTQWVMPSNTLPCFLVVVENLRDSARQVALWDAYRYHLTPREADIWALKQADLSYQAIADKLFIHINTVKKHMKNIYAKREQINQQSTQNTQLRRIS